MTDAEIFNLACNRLGLGKRVDIENYPHVPAAPAYAYTRKTAETLITSARAMFPTLLPIHFDFVEVGSINAWAFREDDKYFIALTAGAMSMIHLILNRMLANPRTFPKIGKPDAEDPNLPPVPWTVPDAELLFYRGVRPVLPKCPIRMVYASHLADQALMFLVGHEIAHITRGHVDYLSSKSGSPFLAELGWQGNQQASLERQAIEADADSRSIAARCHSALGTVLLHQKAGDKFPPWATAVLPPEAWQFDWAFAVNTLFRLFGDARFSGVDLSAQPYPPLALRRKLVIISAVELLAQAWGESRRTDADRVLSSCVAITESSFTAVGADPADGGLNEAETSSAKEHIQRILDSWDEVRPKLQPFSYEPLQDD